MLKFKCPLSTCNSSFKTELELNTHIENHPGTSTSKQKELKEKLTESIVHDEESGLVTLTINKKNIRINIRDLVPLLNSSQISQDSVKLLPIKRIDCGDSTDDSCESVDKSVRKDKRRRTFFGNKRPQKSVICAQNSVVNEPEKKVEIETLEFRLIDANYALIGKTADRIFNEKLAKDGNPVEYDLDEGDVVWLRVINERRRKIGATPVSMDMMELLIDRLEKSAQFIDFESIYKEKRLKKYNTCCNIEKFSHLRIMSENDIQIPLIEADIEKLKMGDDVCSICLSGSVENYNQILFCDMCNVCVHQECYGVPYIPAGCWWCKKCTLSPSDVVQCALCPNPGGALKRTMNLEWVHVVCVFWIPELQVGNAVFFEPIDGLNKLTSGRKSLVCYICNKKNMGACIKCDRGHGEKGRACSKTYHVTCAQLVGLSMRISSVKKRIALDGSVVTVEKKSYCHHHAKPEFKPIIDYNYNIDKTMSCNNDEKRVNIKTIILRMTRARYFLKNQKISKASIGIPFITIAKMQVIKEIVSIEDKEEFMIRLQCYWMLKKRDRGGVPLIRRMKRPGPHIKESMVGADFDIKLVDPLFGLEHFKNEAFESEDESNSENENKKILKKSNECDIPNVHVASLPDYDYSDDLKEKVDLHIDEIEQDDSISNSTIDTCDVILNLQTNLTEDLDPDEIIAIYKAMVEMRRNLEKTRLMFEMVRKREKLKLKIEMVQDEELAYILNPLKAYLVTIYEYLSGLDKDGNFTGLNNSKLEKVNLKIIQGKMMLDEGGYSCLQQFMSDINVMLESIKCTSYKSSTLFRRASVLSERGNFMALVFRSICFQDVEMDGKLKEYVDELNIEVPAPECFQGVVNFFNSVTRKMESISDVTWIRMKPHRNEIKNAVLSQSLKSQSKNSPSHVSTEKTNRNNINSDDNHCYTDSKDTNSSNLTSSGTLLHRIVKKLDKITPIKPKTTKLSKKLKGKKPPRNSFRITKKNFKEKSLNLKSRGVKRKADTLDNTSFELKTPSCKNLHDSIAIENVDKKFSDSMSRSTDEKKIPVNIFDSLTTPKRGRGRPAKIKESVVVVVTPEYEKSFKNTKENPDMLKYLTDHN